MNLSEIKAISIPEGEVVKITVGNIVIWEQVVEPTYKNWVPFSINADGTIYNNGLGYKDGYRVRSGGQEGTTAYAVCTGFIPLKVGETIRIYPPFTGQNSVNTINFYDGSFTNLGQHNDGGSVYGICEGTGTLYKTTVINGVSTLTLTSQHNADIRYVRVTNAINTSHGSPITTGADMIITVNEEINL